MNQTIKEYVENVLNDTGDMIAPTKEHYRAAYGALTDKINQTSDIRQRINLQHKRDKLEKIQPYEIVPYSPLR